MVVYHERLGGFREACATYGLAAEKSLSWRARPIVVAAWPASTLPLPVRPRSTGAVCFNDAVAFGAMISLRKRGIEPGQDFAVVGFDDIVEAEHYVPALTSVAVDTVGLGERAAHAVLRMIQSRSTRAEDHVGAVKLIVRESSGPDRDRGIRRRCHDGDNRRKTWSHRVSKVIPTAAAAALIGDGMVVSVSSSSGLGCPDAVLAAIGERFDAEGAPRNITTLHPIAAGDMYGIKGIDHLAKPGLLKRTLCGSYPSGPSSSEPPQIWKMIGDNSVAAYNVPSGILFDMHREAAAKRPGVLTKVGLDTFVDPRHQGCAMNAAANEPIVSVQQFDGEEWLYFRSIVPNVVDHPRDQRRRARQPHLRA